MISTAWPAIKQLLGPLKLSSPSHQLLMRYHSALSAALCKAKGAVKTLSLLSYGSDPPVSPQPNVQTLGSSPHEELEGSTHCDRVAACSSHCPHKPTVFSPNILSWFVNSGHWGITMFCLSWLPARGPCSISTSLSRGHCLGLCLDMGRWKRADTWDGQAEELGMLLPSTWRRPWWVHVISVIANVFPSVTGSRE